MTPRPTSRRAAPLGGIGIAEASNVRWPISVSPLGRAAILHTRQWFLPNRRNAVGRQVKQAPQMPIYQCITPVGTVADAVRPQIAKEITRLHVEATNAPPSFVHVIVATCTYRNSAAHNGNGGVNVQPPADWRPATHAGRRALVTAPAPSRRCLVPARRLPGSATPCRRRRRGHCGRSYAGNRRRSSRLMTSHVTAAAICRASAHSSPANAPSACGTEQ